MAQTSAIVKVLKKALKAHGIRYSDIAKALELTEASVKRLFSEEQFSLKRLDQICQLMDMEISDLTASIRTEANTQCLSIEQEQELVSKPSLLLVANCVLNGWSFSDIVQVYRLEASELIQYLAQLDRMKLIELLPRNRIKLLIDPEFRWQKNGPIQRFFDDQVQKEFFNCRFDHAGEKRLVLTGMLSLASSEAFRRKLEKLGEEFRHLHYEDEKLLTHERFGTTAVLAVRHWEPQIFEDLRRQKDQRKI